MPPIVAVPRAGRSTPKSKPRSRTKPCRPASGSASRLWSPDMADYLDLAGKVALVTGTGSQIGIGRAVAKALAAQGAVVAANDLAGDDLERTVAELQEAGAEASAHAADVADREAVRAMVADVERRYGRIDVLVNNAGIAKRAPFATMSEAEDRRTPHVHLRGHFHPAHARP